MQYALRVLGYRARSEEEMRRKLQCKGFSAEITDHTLAELYRLGLLDDRDFAHTWVSNRPGYGPIRLRQELRLKGIDRDLAEETITAARTGDAEFNAALQIAERAARRRTLPLDRMELLRLRRLLQRRGYTSDIVNRVCAGIDEHLSTEGEWLE